MWSDISGLTWLLCARLSEPVSSTPPCPRLAFSAARSRALPNSSRPPRSGLWLTPRPAAATRPPAQTPQSARRQMRHPATPPPLARPQQQLHPGRAVEVVAGRRLSPYQPRSLLNARPRGALVTGGSQMDCRATPSPGRILFLRTDFPSLSPRGRGWQCAPLTSLAALVPLCRQTPDRPGPRRTLVLPWPPLSGCGL